MFDCRAIWVSHNDTTRYPIIFRRVAVSSCETKTPSQKRIVFLFMPHRRWKTMP